MASLTYRIGALASALVLLGIVAACSGAKEQDVLSNQVGGATTSSGGTGSSGDTTSGATSSGTSGQTTSGGPGTSSGGTTSGAPSGGCAEEKEDSTEAAPLTITSCAKGTLKIPVDEEDWLKFERPANSSLHAKWSGPVAVTFWDAKGNAYDLQHLPSRQGTYTIQLQYDFKSYPLSGDQIAKAPTFDWTFEIAFQ